MTDPQSADRVHVLIEIRAAPGRADETRDRFLDVIRTASKPGFVDATVYASETDDHVFYSLQRWDSAEAFRTHMSDSAEGLQESQPLLSGAPTTVVLRELWSGSVE